MQFAAADKGDRAAPDPAAVDDFDQPAADRDGARAVARRPRRSGCPRCWTTVPLAVPCDMTIWVPPRRIVALALPPFATVALLPPEWDTVVPIADTTQRLRSRRTTAPTMPLMVPPEETTPAPPLRAVPIAVAAKHHGFAAAAVDRGAARDAARRHDLAAAGRYRCRERVAPQGLDAGHPNRPRWRSPSSPADVVWPPPRIVPRAMPPDATVEKPPWLIVVVLATPPTRPTWTPQFEASAKSGCDDPAPHALGAAGVDRCCRPGSSAGYRLRYRRC